MSDEAAFMRTVLSRLDVIDGNIETIAESIGVKTVNRNELNDDELLARLRRMNPGEVIICRDSADSARRVARTVGKGYMTRSRKGVVYVALDYWPDFTCAPRGKVGSF